MLLLVCLGTVFEYCATALSLVYAEVLAREFLGNAIWCVYATQLAAIIFRPIGGYLLGKVGDKTNALTALRYSTLLMLCSTFLMACLPTYKTIGAYAASLLFIFVQCMQMLSAGGELNFAAIHLINNMTHKGVASGIAWAATSAGWLCAWCLRCVFCDSGWRFAYLATTLLGLVSLCIRSNTVQNDYGDKSIHTESGHEEDAQHHTGIIVTFSWAAAVGAYTYYALQYRRVEVSEMYVVAAYVLAVIANIVSGYLYDLYGRFPAQCGLIASLLVLCIRAEIAFVLFPVALSLWKAPTHVLSQKFVSVRSRCGSLATFYALGTSIAGRGAMICCYSLDVYCDGLSVLWPVSAVMLGYIALCIDARIK